MKYKQSITKGMEYLGSLKSTVFIGEGLINAGRIYGTLNNVSTKKCIEMPIAENLIAGAAVGMAIEGLLPIVIFQRMDFMLIAADAIINHMSLMPHMSGGQITLPIILRTIIGSTSKKFDVGPQHNHDFTHVFKPYIRTIKLEKAMMGHKIYPQIFKTGVPTLVVERKDWYE